MKVTEILKSIEEKVEAIKTKEAKTENLMTELEKPLQNDIQGQPYHCNYCGKQNANKIHIKTHKKSKHCKIKYICYKCGYSSNCDVTVKKHVHRKHRGLKENNSDCETFYNMFLQPTLESYLIVTFEAIRSKPHMMTTHVHLKLFMDSRMKDTIGARKIWQVAWFIISQELGKVGVST